MSSSQALYSTLAQVINLIILKMTTFLNHTILIPSTTLWNWSTLAMIHLKCAFELLLQNPFSFSPRCLYNIPKTGFESELMGVIRFESLSGCPEQCAVCLGDVEDGDEVGELPCCHVFHQLCLQKWVQSSKLMTCPLCRGSLAPKPIGEADFGVEVIFFKFCSFARFNDADQLDNDSWWLR